jgi:hypothetical protein
MLHTEETKAELTTHSLNIEKMSFDKDLPRSAVSSETEATQFDPTVEKHLRHKFDRRILTLGIIIYLMAQIDRSNMGNAQVMGQTTFQTICYLSILVCVSRRCERH